MSSFLGEVTEFEELTTRMKVVRRLHSSADGIAEIFLGDRMGKKFILKTLKDVHKADPVYSHILRKEFEIGFSLSHPGIARTLSLEEIDGIGTAIVEEYIPGKTLETLIQSGELKEKDAIEIIRELISALSYIHDNQTVHNDLKPSNIIVSGFDGKPKIIDFGFADSPGYTSMKFKGGTAEYIAPERLSGDSVGEPRNDVWSLGVIARKLAPFAGKNHKKVLKFADKCCVPFSTRERDVKKLLPYLDKKGTGNGRFLFWLLLIAASAILIFSRGKLHDEQTLHEPNLVEAANKEQKTTPQNQESPKEEETVKTVETPKVQPPNNTSPRFSRTTPPEASSEAAEVAVHSGNLAKQYDQAETEIYYTLARNYALRLTAEMIAKRKTEGKFHQHETREQLLESRYEYERLMQAIKEYVETIGIPSDTLQSAVIKDAQKAATNLIHEEAAKRDGFQRNGT